MLEMRQSAGITDAVIRGFLDLPCWEGVRAAEISNVFGITGGSEPVIYKQSQSKEDLASAFLKDRHAIWMHWFENEIAAMYEATGGGLEIIADVLQKGFEDQKDFGIAFIHTMTQGGDFDDEPFAIVIEQKEHLGRFIEQLAIKMGLQHPDRAGSAAVFVIERTIMRTLMTGSLEEAQTARLLFQCLQHT